MWRQSTVVWIGIIPAYCSFKKLGRDENGAEIKKVKDERDLGVYVLRRCRREEKLNECQ